jgi:hypothetical protein
MVLERLTSLDYFHLFIFFGFHQRNRNPLLPSAFCFLLSAFCLLPSALCFPLTAEPVSVRKGRPILALEEISWSVFLP